MTESETRRRYGLGTPKTEPENRGRPAIPLEADASNNLSTSQLADVERRFALSRRFNLGLTWAQCVRTALREGPLDDRHESI